MADFKTFVRSNKIKQAELANMLGISKPFMSQVVNGTHNLSMKNYEQLLKLANERGWDTTPLLSDASAAPVAIAIDNSKATAISGSHHVGQSGDTSEVTSLRRQVAVLEKENEMLQNQIADKDRTIELLTSVINTLKK